MKRKSLLTALALLLTCCVFAQQKIAAINAAKYMDKTVTMNDKIYSTDFDEETSTAFLYVGQNYPSHYLTVIVRAEYRNKVGEEEPEIYFKFRAVRITGKIVEYKGKPAIYVTSAAQLRPLRQ